jgi:hypothetical protein
MLDPTRGVEIALHERLDLRNTGDGVEDSRRSVRLARNQMLPDLDLRADLRLPTDSARQYGGFDLDPGQGSVGAGLTFDLPLDRRQEWLAYRSSLVRLEQTQRNYQLERDRVALEVRSTIRQVRRDRFNLDLQQRNVALAQRRMVEVDLKARTLGPEQVISATEDLLDAENRLVEARRSYRQNTLQFLLATGQMRISAEGQWMPPARFEHLREDAALPGEPVPPGVGAPDGGGDPPAGADVAPPAAADPPQPAAPLTAPAGPSDEIDGLEIPDPSPDEDAAAPVVD